MTPARRLAAALLAVAGVLTLAACGPSQSLDIGSDSPVLDVVYGSPRPVPPSPTRPASPAASTPAGTATPTTAPSAPTTATTTPTTTTTPSPASTETP